MQEQMSTRRLLFARLSDSLFLAQIPMSAEVVAEIRKEVKDPRLKADEYYYLYILERVESEQGRISFYLNQIDDRREYDKLSKRSPDAEIIGKYSGMVKHHFVAGPRRAVLKTVLGSAEVKSSHLFWFRKVGTG